MRKESKMEDISEAIKLALKTLKRNNGGIYIFVQSAAKAGLLQAIDVVGLVFSGKGYYTSLAEL